ncbi:MAG: DUF5686 family protein [Dysgonamonadaceae bacterium]|nr:DUF5686 family protein [Dysgonamonadaceae bacterium]
MDIQALRYYPFKTKADSIVKQLIDKKKASPSCSKYDAYQKTGINLIANKESLNDQLNNLKRKNYFIYKHIIQPYIPFFKYAHPQKENPQNLVLTTALYEDYFTCYSDNTANKEGRMIQSSLNRSIYNVLGEQNIASLLNDFLGDVDLYKKKSDVMFDSFSGPLNENAFDHYTYFLSEKKTGDGEPFYEIVFFPNKINDSGFAGYLYVTADGNNILKKAVFSLNNIYNSNSFIKEALFIQQFDEKENIPVLVEKKSRLFLGDDRDGCIMLTRNTLYSNYIYPEYIGKNELKNKQAENLSSKENTFWETHRLEPLTDSEMQIENLIDTISNSSAFRNMETLVNLLLTNHLTIGGKNGIFELGDISKIISFNEIEGYQIKAEGNTTLNLNKHLLVGGYVTYGLKSKLFNYRGDIIYSFPRKDKSIWEFPRSSISFTYLKDLSIPGYDILTSDYDDIFFGIVPPRIKTLLLQKMGLLAYDKEFSNKFSFRLEGKHLYQELYGADKYGGLKTSEINISMHYAPTEIFFQSRDNRYCIRRGDDEINFRHRIGLSGIFGSKYDYHITDGSISKWIAMPEDAGKVYAELSAGKVWSRLPFYLLFVLTGNESYVFDKKGFNLMNYHEFATDNFVAGNVNLYFNWSPVRLFAPKNKIRTSIGSRFIYGPLSENNNPALHNELFPFSKEIIPLGNQPYIETNIGFSNIFQIFRIEYVRRLTYLDTGNKISKGALRIHVGLEF